MFLKAMKKINADLGVGRLCDSYVFNIKLLHMYKNYLERAEP